MKSKTVLNTFTALLLTALMTDGKAIEISGNLSAESRLFANDPLTSTQHNGNLSISVQPEFYNEWNDGGDSVTFVPFARMDQGDDDRSHTDIRELTWVHLFDQWEARIGIRKVFWGVTESRHLVDIINQTDQIEGLDGEEKLGQPMVNLSWSGDEGVFDLFILPGFRERTFPGEEGRLRTSPRIDSDLTQYEASEKDQHLDYAVRWSQTLGDWDLGLTYFDGTNRDPALSPMLNGNGQLVLAPYYEQIKQYGIDIQATFENWLWKLEAIQRNSNTAEYFSSVAGFEYSFYGIGDSATDMGMVVEHLYDDRDASASTPFENDIFLGARFSLNDAESTEILAGVIADFETSARFYSLEANRRLGETLKITVEARVLSGQESTDPFYSLRDDDFIQAELAWFF